MRKQSRLHILLVLLLLFSLLLAAVVTSAQDSGSEGETEDHAAAVEGEEAVIESAPSPLTPLGINSGFLIAQIINFGVIFLALLLLLWRPLINMLDVRAQKIAKGLEDASIAANARRDAEAEAEKIRAAAQSEVQKVIDEGRQRGDEVAKQIEVQARQEAEKILADARVRTQEERNSELAGLRGQVAAISVAVAQRLIGESLDQKRQQALIDDFFSKVPAGAKSLGGHLEVVSAMPLDDKEQAKVKKEIGADDVTFSVDPSILGGLIIRSGDRVVDGSVRSGLNEMADRLR